MGPAIVLFFAAMPTLISAVRRSVHRSLGTLVAGVILALAGTAAGAGPATAQSVVGSVLERGTARPLQGAFVVLVTEGGQRLNGVLSRADGGFVIRAPRPGRYRLMAEMIGYGTTMTEVMEVAEGPAHRQDILVAIQAVSLEGIQVETGERCRRRPGSGAETARLWDEARKALEVTRWSGERGVLRFLTVAHTRELEADSWRVVSQIERPRRGYHDGSPYASIPAAELHERGFVRPAEDGTWDYFAPDAAVLLSDEFLDDHCFRVVPPRPHEPELIGLGFQPVPERSLPDVTGVLWLERGTAELRRLDYSYENLPFRHDDWSAVGGRVEFERLATGMWIVRRWHIRMPMTARETGGFGGSARRLELLTLSEMGAEVREVRTAGGRVLAEPVGATLQGVVTRAGRGDPIEGAVVELPALERETVTGPDGAYRITGLPEGVFDVFVRHSAFILPDGAVDRPTVELRRGIAARHVAELEPRAVTGPVARPGTDGPTWTNGLVGRVLDARTNAGLADATARLLTEDGTEVGTMVTDGTGRFRLIHPGSGTAYIFEVERPGYGSYREEIRLQPGEERSIQVVLQRR